MQREWGRVYFAGDGITFSMVDRLTKEVIGTWRTVEVVDDNEEFLAQGRHRENAVEKRRLNSLPYHPFTPDSRAQMRQDYEARIAA